VKKPQVEKHYTQKCRACSVLTCIDCLKDFEGDEYKTHMTCMSEEQRYSKEGRAGWDPSVGQGNKGEKRQNAWIANLRKILQETSDLDGDVRNILDTIQEHENIPRKKPKFVNFVKNIMRNRARPHSIDKTWELFEQALKPPALPEPMEVEKAENGESDKTESLETNGKDETPEKENEGGKKEKKKKKKKDKKLSDTTENVDTKTSRKRKSSDAGENEDSTTKDEESPVKKAKFDWDEVITACLKEKDGNEMKLVKLKKKCLREYFSAHEGTHKSKEEVGAKFDKKVNKRSYKVLKDRIKLVGVEEEDKKSEEDEEVMQGAASKPEGWKSAPDPKPAAISFNKWEGADMGSDAQTEKFRRLMGIKAAPKPQEVSSKWGRDDKKMLRELEQGFEKARETHFGGRSFTQ